MFFQLHIFCGLKYRKENRILDNKSLLSLSLSVFSHFPLPLPTPLFCKYKKSASLSAHKTHTSPVFAEIKHDLAE